MNDVVISEPNAALYGCCPYGHPRSTRTTIDGSHIHIDTWCTKCGKAASDEGSRVPGQSGGRLLGIHSG